MNHPGESALESPTLHPAPTVLIATTSRWYPTARLAMALAGAGCAVEMVCPPNHPVMKTKACRKVHVYRGLAPLHSFAKAIEDARPDLIIPGDDLSVRHLHRLYARERKRRSADSPICAAIERSLGAEETFPVAYDRARFMQLASEEGIRIPQTEAIANLDGLKAWIARNGLPLVLKANGTSGGDGVRVVHTLEDAERAFGSLQASPRLLRAIKRAVVDHDATLVEPALLRRKFVMNAQAFIPGREATSAVACWKGKVLAALHFEVVNKRSAAGPATVVRLIENAEMSVASEKLVRRLNLSGLHGFDFMLDETAGNAYLIEMNPRATQVGHLALGPGRDVARAFYEVLSGKAVPPAPTVTENRTIALFPQEWARDPESAFLRSAYHDVPWEEPAFIGDCVRNRKRQSAWYSRSDRNQPSSARSSKPIAGAAERPAVGLDWGGK
jgi:hypothetical protein